MRQLNVAYLMKLGWRLVSEPETLWARVLRDKYSDGRHVYNLETQQRSCSNAWRGIMEAMKFTKQGLGAAIGDGRKTFFWLHRWLDGLLLTEQAVAVIPTDHLHKFVSDYWHPSSSWKWTQLRDYLPASVLQRIASRELTTDRIDDQLIWAATESGKFSVKSTLALVRPVEGTNEVDWKRIWKQRVPQRVRVFLWLVFHNKLMTNAERFRRHLHHSSYCEQCQGEVEDLNHIFRRCPRAHEVWSSGQFPGFSPLAGDVNFLHWVNWNLRAQQEDTEWPRKFLLTVWYIWKWRCARCFGEEDTVPREIGYFLASKFREVSLALDQSHPVADIDGRGSTARWVRWEPPPRGWMVLNTDGAAKGNPGQAGAGGVLRGENSEWIIGFSEGLGYCSSVRAELRAVLRGLRLAKEAQATKLWLQIDSNVVVGMLARRTSCIPGLRGLIHQCHTLLEWEGWEVKISHVFREANRVADILANIWAMRRY